MAIALSLPCAGKRTKAAASSVVAVGASTDKRIASTATTQRPLFGKTPPPSLSAAKGTHTRHRVDGFGQRERERKQ